MKRLLLLPLLLLIAATAMDQWDADFQAGLTQTNINITSDQLQLAGTPGTYSSSGTFESQVHDLGSRPTATIGWTSTSPQGTSIILTTRSGNTSAPDASWSAWSAAQANGANAPGQGRYHQYRIQLATTNTNVTPQVSSAYYTYTEQGPNIQVATSQNAPLNSNTTGAYRFHVAVSDTMPLALVEARYRIGTDSYSAASPMSQSGAYWYLDIPEPAGGWEAREGEALTLEVHAQSSASATATFTNLVDIINGAPSLNPILASTATEGVEKRIFVSGYDPDSDPISFTTSHGSVQSISATSAYIVWTPTNNDVGEQSIIVTVTDGIDEASQVVTVTVENRNEPPTLEPISGASGYHGDQITYDLTVRDNDINENLTYWVEPDLFDIEEVTSSTVGTYRAQARFVALDDHRGNYTLTFWVQDSGGQRSSQNATLDIRYCGDNVCQSQENATSCNQDCAVPQSALSYIALELPDRLCTNESFTLQSFEASSRFTCFYEGRTQNHAAYCEPLESVAVTAYAINGSLRTEAGSYTTSANGTTTLTLAQPGSYKLSATKDGHISTTQIVTVKPCDQDITLVDQVVEYDAPKIEVKERRITTDPELERPELTVEDASLLAIVIWYMIIPLLLAGLLYTGNAYYSTYKDVDPRLLRLRLWAWDRRIILEERLQPYWEDVTRIVGPYARPAWRWTVQNVLRPIWKVLRPYALQAGAMLKRLLRL